MRASSASPPKPRARQAWLLVYPLDEKYQRLDLYLADKPGQVPAKDQLSLLRQTAETVSYAHRNRVVHRGLTPHAVLVRSFPDGGAPPRPGG